MSTLATPVASADLLRRLGRVDWRALEEALDRDGHATTSPLLARRECDDLVRLYSVDARFRSHIDMGRFRFGEGDYKYFAQPLPPIVQALREWAYRPLAHVANRWMAALNAPERFPSRLSEFLRQCHDRGQRRPTPLLLHYETGGYNCLHQDLYGEIAFPFQLTVVLSQVDRDYTGGEFLLVEQRPRAQSRGTAIVLQQGEAIIFPTRDRPLSGSRGFYRAALRHGVSRVRSGVRYSLGVIFHDAR